MKPNEDETGDLRNDLPEELTSSSSERDFSYTTGGLPDATVSARETDSLETLKINRIDRYQIGRLLGRGGFGSVYLARDEQLDRRVAIKVAHPDLVKTLADASLYMEEAKNVARLDHPHIVPVHDVGSTDQIPFYFVSKFIDGSNLAKRIHEARIDPIAAAKIAATISEALQHAHKHGLVHRDVKPGNILIDSAGNPYLVDFGLALSDDSVEAATRYVGTPAYTSPEQARGEGHRVDGRSDVFSLGVVLYEMLTRRRPFRGSRRADVLQQVASYEPRPPRQYDETIPKALDRICQKAMAKLATDRYESAFDMAEDLHHFLATHEQAGAVTHASPTAIPQLPPTELAQQSNDPSSGHSESSAVQISTDDAIAGDTIHSESPTSRGMSIVPKGIRSFDSHDADFFLELVSGPRDRDGFPESIRFWKTRLEELQREQTFPIGLIYGPSGCGKSSLVQAGLLPRLSSHVQSVFVEASVDDTEHRILTALQTRFPTLPRDRTLVELVKMIRNGYGPPAGSKVLIVLDQFEQWLHAHSTEKVGELIQTLRQCDGSRVQTLIMVRDDFWMAMTGFMREVEVRISEGHNAAAVDLFPERHALKVLDAFGRSFGTLPKPPEALSDDHQSFLRNAVKELSSDGKVICVRLALFAEIMKSKPWTVESLKKMGGARGVGLKFLEDTFDGPTAPLAYRYHEAAARRSLRLLLPGPGQSLRGHTKTLEELNAASGYPIGSRDFQELMTILDTEVRLVTPSDSVGRPSDQQETQNEPGGIRFQLTHDYLVQSLRTWLTQKQRESRQGRAELCLAERASLWSSKPENRHLPTLSEHSRIRLLTDRQRWTDEETQMMSRGRKVHGLRLAGLGLVFAACAMCALGFRNYLTNQQEQLKAESMVRTLVRADLGEVSETIRLLQPLRQWADPVIAADLQSAEDGSKKKLRLSLASIDDDTDAETYLIERLPQLGIAEFSLVRASLRPSEASLESLWEVALDGARPAAQRFQVGCALAFYANKDSRWKDFQEQMVSYLTADDTAVPARHLTARIDQLMPGRDQFSPALEELLRNIETEEEVRVRAATVLARFRTDRPEKLLDALLLCRRRNELEPMIAAIPMLEESVVAKLEAIGARGPSSNPDLVYEPQHHQIAIATATLAHFGKISSLLVALEKPNGRIQWNPSQRSLTKHYLSELPVDHASVLHVLDDPILTSEVRRELIEVLGRRGIRGLAADQVAAIGDRLSLLFHNDPDPGVHQAAAWALTQLGKPPSILPVSLSVRDESVLERVRDWTAMINEAEDERKEAEKQVSERREQWLQELENELEKNPDRLDDPTLVFRLLVESEEDASVKATLADRNNVEKQIDSILKVGGVQGYSVEFDGETSLDFGDAVRFERDEPFSYGGWVYNRNATGWGGVLSKFSTKGDFRGFDLWLNGDRFSSHIVHSEPDSYLKVTTEAEMPMNMWYHVFATYDGSSKASGLKIYVDGQLETTSIVSDTLDGTILTDAPFVIGSRHEQFFMNGWIDDIRVYNRILSASDVRVIYDASILKILQVPQSDRSPEQEGALRRCYRDKAIVESDSKLRRLRQFRDDLTRQDWLDRKRWFVNGQRQQFTVVPSALASPSGPTFGYDFAIGAHEVTIEQFQNSGIPFATDPDPEYSLDCPVHRVSWFDIARYCNWLSEAEGILSDQWCFQPNSDGEYSWGMVLKPNFRELSGYRLPTWDEFQHAGRSQSESRFFFGEPGELVSEYGWYAGNATGMTKPVGMLVPNGLGVFDIHGNVWEWVLDAQGAETDGTINRGCQVKLIAGAINSATEIVSFRAFADNSPNYVGHYNGFRLAKGIAAE